MKMKSSDDNNEIPITYFLKGTHMRIEMTTASSQAGQSGATVVTIMDLEKREVTVLMPDQKMYMVQSLPDETADKSRKTTDADFKPTGQKEKIAGFEAEEYTGLSEKKLTEIWVTKELGEFVAPRQGPKKGAKTSAWAKFVEQGGFFALRVVKRAKEGAPESFRQEVTKVEKGAQPDALFLPPSDYQKFEMPNMGDMMKGMLPSH